MDGLDEIHVDMKRSADPSSKNVDNDGKGKIKSAEVGPNARVKDEIEEEPEAKVEPEDIQASTNSQNASRLPESESTSNSRPSSSNNPMDLITTMFHRATTAVETTIDQVQPEKIVSRLTGNITTNVFPPIQPLPPRVDPLPRNHPRPSKDTELKLLKSSVSQSYGTTNIGLLVFIQKDMLDIVIVTTKGIEAFEWDHSKILQRDFPVHRGTKQIIRANCAEYGEEENCIVVAHSDGVVRVYDIRSGHMGTLKKCSTYLNMVPSIVLLGGDGGILVGGKEGVITVLNRELEIVKVVQVGHSKRLVKGDYLGEAVGALSFVEGKSSGESGDDVVCWADVLIGRRNGRIAVENGRIMFCAHAGEIAGVLCLSNCIIVSAGLEDSTIAVSLLNGICVSRFKLNFSPTSLSSVQRSKESRSRYPESGCPSECAILVGGKHGEVEIYRIVIYGPNAIDIELIKSLGQRQRSSRRSVKSLGYSEEDSVVLCANENGDIRRWRLNDITASALSLIDMVEPSINENNVKKILIELTEKRNESRLATFGPVIVAQRCMANALGSDFVKEGDKDILVETFQKCQADLQNAATAADVQLRQNAQGIMRRFFNVLHLDKAVKEDEMKVRLCSVGRRTAAVELAYAVGQHKETISAIENDAAKRLGIVLLNALKRTTKEGKDETGGLVSAREQAKKLSEGIYEEDG